MSMMGLNKITDRILADAQAEADRILAEAEADCNRRRAEYEAEAEKIRDTLTADAERDAKDLIARAKASAATQKRNILLQRKSELMDSVFVTTLENVLSMETEPYTTLLIGLLTACLWEQIRSEQENLALYGEEDALAPDQYEVLMNARDRERCGAAVIEGACKRLAGKVLEEKLALVTLSDSTVSIDGGFVLRCGSMEMNCSLSLLFAQLREEMETEVGQALFAPRKQN